MRIRSIAHEGLRKLVEDGDPRGVPGAVVPKLMRHGLKPRGRGVDLDDEDDH